MQTKPIDAALQAYAILVKDAGFPETPPDAKTLRGMLRNVSPQLRTQASLVESWLTERRFAQFRQAAIDFRGPVTAGAAGRLGGSRGIVAGDLHAGFGEPPAIKAQDYYSAKEFLAAADAQKQYLNAAINETQSLRTDNAKQVTELRARHQKALEDLVNALVPNLDPQTTQRAARVTGYVTIERDYQPVSGADKARMSEELRDLGGGATLVSDLAASKARLDKINALSAKCEEHPRVQDLLANGYGTSDYSPGFFRKIFGSNDDAEVAQEIVRAFGAKSWERLREDILAARRDEPELSATVAEMEKRQERCAYLQETLSGGAQLGKARAALASYLGDADRVALAKKLEKEPEIDLFVRVDCLAHQLKYLEELDDKKLGPMEMALRRDRAAMESEIQKAKKLSGTKARLSGAQVQACLGGRAQNYRSELRSCRQVQTRVYEYRSTQIVRENSFIEDLFWWGVYTGWGPFGSFSPFYHDPHENYSPGGSWTPGPSESWGRAPIKPDPVSLEPANSELANQDNPFVAASPEAFFGDVPGMAAGESGVTTPGSTGGGEEPGMAPSPGLVWEGAPSGFASTAESSGPDNPYWAAAAAAEVDKEKSETTDQDSGGWKPESVDTSSRRVDGS